MIPVLKPNPPAIEKWSKYIQLSYEKSTFSNGGPCVQLLEQRLQEYLNLPHQPVLMCNATIALTVALQAYGLHGSIVLMPSFTFAATPHSLLNAGCIPALVDIEDNLQTSLESLESTWKKVENECKALVVVNALGFASDYAKYERFAAEHNLKLIFDSAALLGANYADGSKMGAAGDCEIFSLHVTKTFGIGEGALVTSKNKDFLDKCRQIINFGFNGNGIAETVGVNAKCSEFHAAIGLSVLDEIENTFNRKKEVFDRYEEMFGSLPVKTLKSPSAYQVYPIIFDSKKTRDKVQKALKDENVGTRIYYIPTHHQPYFLPLNHQPLPKTDFYAERILCIPFFESITKQEQELVFQIIEKNL